MIDGPQKGFVVTARCVMESTLWLKKPDSWFKIWMYIKMEVSFVNQTKNKRGVGFFNYSECRGNLPGITRHVWNRCIAWLEEIGEIIIKHTPRGLIITVVSYEREQSFDTYRIEPRKTGGNHKRSKNTSEPEKNEPEKMSLWKLQKIKDATQELYDRHMLVEDRAKKSDHTAVRKQLKQDLNDINRDIANTPR